MIVWLLSAAAVWLAAVVAVCLLLTAVKRADAQLDSARALRMDPASGGLPVNDASGVLGPRIGAIAAGEREPRLAAEPIAVAAGRQADPPLWPPLRRDVDRSSPPQAYALYVHEEPVAQLHWGVGPGRPAGWYLWQRGGGWQRLAVDPELDAGFDGARPDHGSRETGELAATVSVALALDAAANLLNGRPTPAARPLRGGLYEIHACGLAADVVPLAFPETVIGRGADVSVLAGHFDDVGLTVLVRRVAILGGRVLAIFNADPIRVQGRPR